MNICTVKLTSLSLFALQFKVVAKPASESNNEVVIDLEAALRK